MWSGRARRRSGIEDALRAHRAEASTDFVDDVSRRIAATPGPAGRGWSRLAFASAVTVFILGTFASFGGLSYAASGATGTYAAVQQVVVKHKLKVSVYTSSAAGQYPHAPTQKPAVKPVVKTHVKPHGSVLGTQAVSANTLPFTGISLLATFVVSLGLIGAGIVMRRRERRN
jgi:hypothetical protein